MVFMKKLLVGIDEVGRGPLAGPVAVGVVAVTADFDWEIIQGVNDSKKLSAKQRELIYKAAYKLRQQKLLNWQVTMVAASVIDKQGIVFAIKKAMQQSLKKLKVDAKNCLVKLDGGLRAPDTYRYQETIIKGDSKEKVIGLASIVAKVTRDNYMTNISAKEEYFVYGFDSNMGYGTRSHCEIIRKYGLSTIHRASFCRRLNK